MRSTAWLEANEVEVGGYVRLAFEELKVDDDGWVRSISSCPAIEPGDGCVVTGTFTHLNDDVHELTFVDSDVVLQPTGLHPLWSEDRDGWVRTHDLEVGERLRSEQGPLEIATIRRLKGARQVFNLEVASDHTYLVSDSAILSHNVCGQEIGILRDAAKGKGNFGLGSGTRAESNKLGKAWVGDDYKVASDGKTLVSKDGLRQYRPPSFKPRLGKTQANFEQRFPGQESKQWQSNGHLVITD